jgi:hypothetical protein
VLNLCEFSGFSFCPVCLILSSVPHFLQKSGQNNNPVIAGQEHGTRNIVFELRNDTIRKIADTNRSYDALQYSLLFWKGEDNYILFRQLKYFTWELPELYSTYHVFSSSTCISFLMLYLISWTQFFKIHSFLVFCKNYQNTNKYYFSVTKFNLIVLTVNSS